MTAVIIKSRALERWMKCASLDEATANEIINRAKEQVQEAMNDKVHPMLAAQAFLACLAACFEGCDLPKKQRREFINDFYQLIEPVVADQARTWAPDGQGVNLIVN